jgi:DNA-binding Lrp family transcriptional regulator
MQTAAKLLTGEHMVTSIILMNVERTKINEVAELLKTLPGISEVYSVSGNYDLVAIVRVATNDELADLVTKRMHVIEAIQKTETMLAFKAYSRHDLESMFAVGM